MPFIWRIWGLRKYFKVLSHQWQWNWSRTCDQESMSCFYAGFYFNKSIKKCLQVQAECYNGGSLSQAFRASNYVSLVAHVKSCHLFLDHCSTCCGAGKKKLIRWVTYPENTTVIWVRAKASFKCTLACSFKHPIACSLLDVCMYVNVCVFK